jgi:hypothetical protein
MSLAKNFYNKAVPTRNLISTITGIVILVLSALSLFNVITPEQQSTLAGYVTEIIGIIVGIINMFKLTDGT